MFAVGIVVGFELIELIYSSHMMIVLVNELWNM